MGSERDPLSVRYDTAVRRILIQAIRAQKDGHGVRTWVHSPGPEYRDLDRGGRTRSERAFTRSAYYQVVKVPPRRWSLKLTWGKLEKRGSRYGRHLTIRLYKYGSGYRHAEGRASSSYIARPELRAAPGRIGGE